MKAKHGLLLAALALSLGSRTRPVTFSSTSLTRSRKRLNVKEWIGSVETSATGDTKALTREIRDLGRKGRFEEAKEKFQQAETKDAILYSAIISAAGNEHFEEAMDFFEEMKGSGVELSDTVYSAVLKVLGNKGDYPTAKRTWDELHALGLSEVGSPRQQSCFTGLLNAAAFGGDVEAVREEMAATPHGVELNAAHFGCLLKACREAVDPVAAEGVIQQMRNVSMERNIVHYTIWMGTCARHAAKTHSEVEEMEKKVLGYMAQDQVEVNDYFLEEQVALNLETASLRALQEEGAERPSAAALARTARLLASPGPRLTRGLRDLRAKYPALRQEA